MNQHDAEELTASLGQIVTGSWRTVAAYIRMGVPQALGASREEWIGRLGAHVRLSIEERREAVLELKANGHSNRETAEILGVREGTVRNDLGAQNCADEEQKADKDNGTTVNGA
jgi:DNA-binding NarL/FixJ family response regulator